MKYSRYNYSTEKESTIFEFTSIGNKGHVKKLVQYTEMNIEQYYNLGFGDYNEESGEIDDEIITNNGDSLKILATVVSTIYAFTAKYPKAYVYATGSNDVRTRLYRMGITINLEELKDDFYVYGLKINNSFEAFIPGEDYLGFLVKRKNEKIEI